MPRPNVTSKFYQLYQYPKYRFFPEKKPENVGIWQVLVWILTTEQTFVTIPGERCSCLQHTDDPNYLAKSDNLSLDTCFVGLISYDYFWVRLFAR